MAAPSSIGMGGLEIHQVQDVSDLKPAGGDAAQSPGINRDDLTPYEWNIRQMGTPNHNVIELLDRITKKESLQEGSPRTSSVGPDIESSPLCDFCHHVFAHLKPDPPREDAPRYMGGLWTPDRKTQSTAQFERAVAENTCAFCRLLWNQLDSRERGESVKDIGEDDILLNPASLPLVLRVGYPFSRASKFLHLAPCHETEVVSLSSVSDSCNSVTSWAIANHWLRRCVSGHEKCRKLAPTNPKLPTRLVDLGPGAHVIRPRLCYSVNVPRQSRYTTLSHRWGGTIMPVLTLTTLQAWMDAIPISALSPTFRDAMEATKRLGVRYIWIDSLCIIQDSEDDWRHEAAAMGDVYQNSYCSLSATVDHSVDNRGLFVQRNPRDVYPCVVKPRHELWKGGDCREWYCLPRDIFAQNVTQSPLMGRGWVVQEHILAPRILHFAEQQIFWECLELQACESLPGGLLDTKLLKQGKLSVDPSSLEAYGAYTGSPYRKLSPNQFLWNEVVERYSTTTLTFPAKDKLAALSGLAKAIGIESDYLAGLWRENLACHLTWGRHAGSAILERPSSYQAPSWSWACVNGRIFTTRVWPLKGETVVVDILSASVLLRGPDPMGPVTGGCLRLRGSLAPVVVHRLPPRKGCVEICDYEVREDLSRDDKIQVHPDVDFDSVDDGDSGSHRPTAAFHFLLVIARNDTAAPGGYGSGDGILLEPTGAQKGEFYRRGRFMCGPHYSTEGMRPFLDLFRMSATTLDPDHYICASGLVEPVFGLPTYEISII